MWKLLLSLCCILLFTNHGQALPIKSWEESKYVGVFRQEHSTDCGPASVKTVLNYLAVPHKDLATPKQASLQDLQQIYEQAGIVSRGYKVEYSHLEYYFSRDKPAPLITQVDNGNPHFLVLLGMADDHLIVADPALGLQAMPANEFTPSWSGYVLHPTEVSLGNLGQATLSTISQRVSNLADSISDWRWSIGMEYTYSNQEEVVLKELYQSEVTTHCLTKQISTHLSLSDSLQLRLTIPLSVTKQQTAGNYFLDSLQEFATKEVNTSFQDPQFVVEKQQEISPSLQGILGLGFGDLTGVYQGITKHYDPLLLTARFNTNFAGHQLNCSLQSQVLFAANQHLAVGLDVTVATSDIWLNHRILYNNDQQRRELFLGHSPGMDRFSLGFTWSFGG